CVPPIVPRAALTRFPAGAPSVPSAYSVGRTRAPLFVREVQARAHLPGRERAAAPSGRRAAAAPRSLVDLLVDLGDLLHPPVPLLVRDAEDLLPRPVKMVRDEPYLLEELVQGVGRYSPSVPRSKSKFCSQCG